MWIRIWLPDSDSALQNKRIRIRNPGLNGPGYRINVANSRQDFSARPAEIYDAGEIFLTFMNGNKNLFEENLMKIRPQICVFLSFFLLKFLHNDNTVSDKSSLKE
jgi:hypothetical protein